VQKSARKWKAQPCQGKQPDRFILSHGLISGTWLCIINADPSDKDFEALSCGMNWLAAFALVSFVAPDCWNHDCEHLPEAPPASFGCSTGIQAKAVLGPLLVVSFLLAFGSCPARSQAFSFRGVRFGSISTRDRTSARPGGKTALPTARGHLARRDSATAATVK